MILHITQVEIINSAEIRRIDSFESIVYGKLFEITTVCRKMFRGGIQSRTNIQLYSVKYNCLLSSSSFASFNHALHIVYFSKRKFTL